MDKLHWRVQTVRSTILAFFLLAFSFCSAQKYQNNPESELAIGVEVIGREIIYGKTNLHVTDPGSIALQQTIRHDLPLKLFTKNNRAHYIDISGQAGFLFCKGKVFDTAYTDPITNRYIRQQSSNPTYFPLSLGAHTISKLTVGVEIFYWKGLGTRDIWGFKFLSLGYNARQFRIAVGGERYAQLKNANNKGTLLSFEFLWKLIKGG